MKSSLPEPRFAADHAELPEGAKARRRLKSGWVVLGVAVGLMGSCVVGLYVIGKPAVPAAPVLTWERLEAAERQWQAKGPRSYKLEVEVRGAQPGHVVLQVQNGEVIAMSRDGATPRQRRTWDYWTVPNQFGILRTDLENAGQAAKVFGADSETAVLRAQFDSEYGYPIRYERLALGGMGEMRWQITRFEPTR